MGEKKKIVIVDDSELVLSCAKEELEKYYQLHCVSNYVESNKIVFREKFDLMLMDINMPGLKGNSICKIYKKNSPGLTILFHSDMDPAKLEKLAREFDSDGFIHKGGPGTLAGKIEYFFRDMEKLKDGHRFADDKFMK